MTESAPQIQPEETPQVSAARARVALQWAAEVASDPDLADSAPEQPSPAEWRELEKTSFREGMDALLLGKFPEPGLDALHQMGGLDVWLPEVAGMVGFGDGEWRHKDVWKHTKQVVKQSMPRIEVRWGALLHDIGKPRTRRIAADGTVTFYGHAEVGASMFRKKLAPRLGLDGAFYERIHYLILHHLRASQYETSWTDAAVRRFYKQMGEGLRDLLDLSRADITTKRPEKRRRGVHQISALSKRIHALEKVDSKVPPLPKGLGTLLMDRFGIPPSKRLGDIRKMLESDCEEGICEGGQSAEYYADYLAANTERYEL